MTTPLQESFNFESENSGQARPLVNLYLKRPLVFFDLETTGLDFLNDRIVQFAFIRLEPDKSAREWMELVNPGTPIPPEASAVHGITDAMVFDKPGFDHFAPKISDLIKDCDLAGFNVIKFDAPFLQAEMARHGFPLDLENTFIIDPQVIYHKNEPRDLSAAYRFYCQKELTDAHDALADVRATLHILDVQVEKYGRLPKDIKALHKYCNADQGKWVTQDRKFMWKDGEAVLSFGKHRGKTLKWLHENETDYLRWMRDSDFSEETKAIIQNAINGIFPQKSIPAEDD